MKVLVTGGSGFLGSHVAEQLTSMGHGVRALVRKSSNTKFLAGLSGIELAYGAVEDRDSVAKAAEGVDAIVHSAGLVKAKDAAEFDAINVEGTRNLLEVALDRRKQVRRFVMVSSLAAHGPSADGTPVAHDREPTPVTNYGRSKLAAERLVTGAKDDLSVTTIRPPAIYGPRDTEMLAFFEAMSMGMLPIMGGGRQKISLIYAGDCARACIMALEKEHESGRAYYVEDGGVYTTGEMADLFLAGTGKRLLKLPVPSPILYAAAFGNELLVKATGKARIFTRDKVNELLAPHWVCSSEPIRKELGWAPELGWVEGAKRTAAWYRENGWIKA
ncbi:MAG: SDR family NAD(P)-dependent oxidoreductase [Deltaproteobacteria bacterium]|nr:SDR family NAD(P)-dependent oxidoreductase [Deltaproteobacteria bacterium]